MEHHVTFFLSLALYHTPTYTHTHTNSQSVIKFTYTRDITPEPREIIPESMQSSSNSSRVFILIQ